MQLADVLNGFVFAGAVIFGTGLFILTMLQIMLMVRFKKFMFTFLPILFFPGHELSDKEKFIRKIGVVLCVMGAIPILASFVLTSM